MEVDVTGCTLPYNELINIPGRGRKSFAGMMRAQIDCSASRRLMECKAYFTRTTWSSKAKN